MKETQPFQTRKFPSYTILPRSTTTSSERKWIASENLTVGCIHHTHAKPTLTFEISRGLLFVALCSITVLVGLHQLLPTEREIELAHHYYGNSVVNNLPGGTWRIREAQQTADAARKLHLEGTELKPLDDGLIDNDHHVDETATSTTAASADVPQQRRFLKHSHHHNPGKRGDSDTLERDELHDGCEATVLIIRHCEKGSIAEHCALLGYERSVYLASLFGDDKKSRWPLPSFIFAESPESRHNKHKMNFREVETVGPLAEKAHILVDDSYTDNTLSDLSKELLHQIKDGNVCGKLAVIVWKHSRIAHAARALGCGPEQGCPIDYSGRSFDQVWQMKFVYRTWEHSTRKRHFIVHAEIPAWKVFGSVQYENFDPLAVSKQFGDYPPTGTATGDRWEDQEVAYPERKRVSDTAGWKVTMVGFPKPLD